METESWLLPGFRTRSGAMVRRRVSSGSNWQIYDVGANARLLACTKAVSDKWVQSSLLAQGSLETIVTGQSELMLLEGGTGYRLESIDFADCSYEASDAEAFAHALVASVQIAPGFVSREAVYVERLSRVLPTLTVGEPVKIDRVIGAWITGGVEVSLAATRRIRSLAPWLTEAEVARLQEIAPSTLPTETDSLADVQSTPTVHSVTTFSLPGRPALEAFFNEHVIDIVSNEERYRRLGIGFPGAILLHGPPGSGKTHAVDKLVDHLDWPNFSIDCGSVGSPYIHETGRKIATVFEEAAKASPSVVVIDEIDAFLAAREDGAGAQHRVEEVSEFLRRIPEAAKNRVLVVGMTNRLAALDPAAVRRGRFDHILEVGMPSEAECLAALRTLLSEIPTRADLNLEGAATLLAGRPLSDVGFVVREACRLAAKGFRDDVGAVELEAAIRATPSPSEGQKTRRIGFV